MGIGQSGDIEGNMRTFLQDEAKEGKKEIFSEIYTSVMEYRDDDCANLVAKALEDGETCGDILDEGLIAAMDTIGELFSSGEIFVPEMLISARAMKAGLEVLRPILTASKEPPKGTVVMATVQGDLHDIGKNLVDIIMTNNGYDVINLGIKQEITEIVNAQRKYNADCIAMSGLLVKSTAFMLSLIHI